MEGQEKLKAGNRSFILVSAELVNMLKNDPTRQVPPVCGVSALQLQKMSNGSLGENKHCV